MEHLDCVDELDLEIERFARLLEGADVSTPVPTCPDWTVAALSEHLGTIHRWADRLVATRSAVRVSLEPGAVGPGPYDAAWLRAGGTSLVATLREADPEEVTWAWGVDQHVRFWSRRQLHETLIHRVDLELALGRTPVLDATVAEDTVDEFLVNLKAAERFSPRVRELRGRGEVLGLTSTERPRHWSVSFAEDGFVVSDDDDRRDASLTGRAGDLALVLTRRRPLGDAALVVAGDEALVRFWLEHSAVE